MTSSDTKMSVLDSSQIIDRNSFFLDRFVLQESDLFRKVWDISFVIMLMYIAIIFPYRLAFVNFRLREDNDVACTEPVESEVALMWEWIVSGFFWIDLFLSFFLSYRRKDGIEEKRFCDISKAYLKTYFLVNLVACLPAVVFEPLFGALPIDPGGCSKMSAAAESNKVVRIVRLQRMTRLARLARLARVLKFGAVMTQKMATSLNVLRGVRISNWLCFLVWVCHILACGWYLTAALHTNHQDTWVARRTISNEGVSLLTASEVTQWIHSVYFILTVFTTVGFGDMSAATMGEILYVIAVFFIGAVVHSIIIGEVINLVSEVDRDTEWKQKQQNLLAAYKSHTSLSEKTLDELRDFVQGLAPQGGTYNREEVRKFFTSIALPRRLLGEMPEQLFDGRLVRNRFMEILSVGNKSPRLVVLLSTMLVSQRFRKEEVVYSRLDYAFNIFLVMNGTFAMVADICSGSGSRASAEQISHAVNDRTSSAGLGMFRKISKHEERVRLDPDDIDRTYSSCASKHGRVLSSRMDQAFCAWTAAEEEDSDPWLQIDLGKVRHVCGVVLAGHPLRDQWVTSFKVKTTATLEDEWTEISTLGEDFVGCRDRDTRVERRFGPILARFVRILPTKWNEKCSARAGVVALCPRLYPYQLCGRLNFFGHEVGTGGRRSATVRCEEQSGEVLLLHKRDLMAGGGGGELLAEFPQLVRMLRSECLRREARHERALANAERSTRKMEIKAFAAATIQDWYRHRIRHPCLPEDPAGASIEDKSMAHSRKSLTKPVGGTKHQPSFEDRVALLLEGLSAGLRDQMSAVQADVGSLRQELSAMRAEMDARDAHV